MAVILVQTILTTINMKKGRQSITYIVILSALLFIPVFVHADSGYYFFSFTEKVKNGMYVRSDLNLIKENGYFSFIRPQKITVKGSGKDISQAKFDAIVNFLANEQFPNVRSKVLTRQARTVNDITITRFEGIFELPGKVLGCELLADEILSCVYELNYKEINSAKEKKTGYWKRKFSRAKKFFADMMLLP